MQQTQKLLQNSNGLEVQKVLQSLCQYLLVLRCLMAYFGNNYKIICGLKNFSKMEKQHLPVAGK